MAVACVTIVSYVSLGLGCLQADLEGTVKVMSVETEQARELTLWCSLKRHPTHKPGVGRDTKCLAKPRTQEGFHRGDVAKDPAPMALPHWCLW